MKNIHSNLVWILLAIIVATTGMCFEIERADSFLSYQNQSTEAEMINHVKDTTTYIGNCTNKLITGLRYAFKKNESKKESISLRNFAGMLLVKKSLQLFLNFWCTSGVLYLLIQNYSSAILNYIHNQDGEK